ncbi:MFS transporter [Metabacillus iocasae]|uniref:MFS family permease n=1 Tax=Priestia iocasae TaxID=2291674 RepID=A0ABS2R0R5_9BACI|nr:MFS transporter [Metabacillus iocasae]MBM7705048.1 MFS family permease [Metabacillus iocasae]
MKPIYYIYLKACSDFSSRMQFIGLTSALLLSENPELWMMLFFIGRQIGALLTSYVAGIVADRFSRKEVMIVAELLSGISVGSLLFVDEPLLIVIVAFILGMTYTFFDVSFRSSVPDMFGKHQLEWINTLLVRVGSIISIVGFAVGGFVSTYFSYKYLVLLDATMYIGSAVVLINVKWMQKPRVHHDSEQPKVPIKKIIQSDGYFFLLVMAFLFPLAASSYQYALPLIAKSDFYNGLMWSTVAFGSFICSLRMKRKAVNRRLYAESLLLFALVVSLSFISKHLLMMLFLLVLVGAVEAIVQVCHYTLLQRSKESIRGRLFGLNTLATRLGFLVGFSLMSIVSIFSSASVGVWIMQGVLAMAVFGWIFSKRST